MKHEVKEIQNRETMTHHVSQSSHDLPDFYLDDDQLEELRVFCDQFNPYQELGLEDKLRLQEYGIVKFDNPFEMTNQLLLLMENNLQYREKNDL